MLGMVWSAAARLSRYAQQAGVTLERRSDSNTIAEVVLPAFFMPGVGLGMTYSHAA